MTDYLIRSPSSFPTSPFPRPSYQVTPERLTLVYSEPLVQAISPLLPESEMDFPRAVSRIFRRPLSTNWLHGLWHSGRSGG
jgi:hypothetical protein